jgi:hypothetical protein
MDAFADLRTRFSFEDFVEKNLLPPLILDNLPGIAPTSRDTKHRTVVCIHWLAGLCQKGNTCEYLHRLDKTYVDLSLK